jgi:hypothetical protein
MRFAQRESNVSGHERNIDDVACFCACVFCMYVYASVAGP